MVSSNVLDEELNNCPDAEKGEAVASFVTLAKRSVRFPEGQWPRLEELVRQGLKPVDAAHLVCAEVAGCDALLTTDDRFLRNVGRLNPAAAIRVDDPLAWLQEQITDERND
jgi:predicted nucleic acid-binding protein